MNAQTEPEQMDAVCTALGVTITAEPIRDPAPFSETPMDGWNVTMTLEGRTLAQKYWQGIGHQEWKVRGNGPGEVGHHDRRYTTAEGRRPLGEENAKHLPSSIRPTLHNVEHAIYRPKPPTAPDVLGCLCADAQGVDQGQTFEDWCSEYGSDPDSRKAEATFHECQSIALRLRGFLGAHYDRVCRAEW